MATILFVADFAFTGDLTENGWDESGGGAPTIAAGSPGLAYPGYAGSNIGNSAGITSAAGQDVAVTLPDVFSGSVYVAFLLRASSVGTGGHFLELGEMEGDSQCNFFAMASGSGYKMGIGKGSTGTYASTVRSVDSTYLVVVKYTFVSGSANDQMRLFVNPAIGGAEPTADLTVSSGSDYALNLSAMQIRQQSTGQLAGRSDGIRVATTWAGAVAPSPSSQPRTRALPATAVSTLTSGVPIPRALALLPPAPNPASGSVRLRFELPRACHVSLDILDVQGRIVARVAEGEFEAGCHERPWPNGNGRVPGMYFVRLQSLGQRLVKRVLVLN